MGESVIKVNGISKKYYRGKAYSANLREALGSLFSKNTKKEEFWALKDISFEVNRGDVVGIIGKNGAGKTTLLKILSRITYPTSGRAELKGKVASLLEVGTGFHPELTGRENVFLNGSILGMQKGEIQLVFDEIVDFSGIEEFIDTPVKRYSSGMYVRLAFSVAAHLKADIILLDEVLSVGDYLFQGKCLDKINKVTKEGKTGIIVSHNFTNILEYCRHSFIIENGCISTLMDSESAINQFYKFSKLSNNKWNFSGPMSSNFSLNKISINDSDIDSVNDILLSPFQSINIKCYFTKSWDGPFRITLSIYRGNNRLFTVHDESSKTLDSSNFISEFDLPDSFLRPGFYTIALGGHEDSLMTKWFWSTNVAYFRVYEKYNDNFERNNLGMVDVNSKKLIKSRRIEL